MSASGNGKNIGVYLTLFFNLVGWLVIAAWNVSATKSSQAEQIQNIREQAKEFRADIKALSDKIDAHINQTAVFMGPQPNGKTTKSNGRN